MAAINNFYTLDAAAKKLGLSYGQLWRRLQKGGIPTIKIGRSILVKLTDVQQAVSGK